MASAGLDYECDPEDEKWLQRFNAQNTERAGKVLAPLKVEMLEALLDRFEQLSQLGEAGKEDLEILSAAPGATEMQREPPSPSSLPPSSPRISRNAKKLRPEVRQAVFQYWQEKRARFGQPLCWVLREGHQYDDGDETIPFRPLCLSVGSRAGGLRQSVRAAQYNSSAAADAPLSGRARPCYKELSEAEILKIQRDEQREEERRVREKEAEKKGNRKKKSDDDNDPAVLARRAARRAAKLRAKASKEKLLRRPQWQKEKPCTPEALEMTPMLLKRCRKVLISLMNQDSQRVFHCPVDVDAIPHYKELIKTPMDFGTVKAKLSDTMESTQYRTVGAFAEDTRLVLRNCLHYNEPLSVIAWLAHQLGITFERRLQWWVLRPSADLPPLSHLGRDQWTCHASGVKFEEEEALQRMVWCDACQTGFDRACVQLQRETQAQSGVDTVGHTEEWFCQYCLKDLPVPPPTAKTIVGAGIPPAAKKIKKSRTVYVVEPPLQDPLSTGKLSPEDDAARSVAWVVKNMVLYVERQSKDEVKRRNAAKAVLEKIIRTLEKEQRQAEIQAKKNAKIAKEVRTKVEDIVRKIVAQHEWQKHKALEAKRKVELARQAAATAAAAAPAAQSSTEATQSGTEVAQSGTEGQLAHPTGPNTPHRGAEEATSSTAGQQTPSRYTRYYSAQHERYYYYDSQTGVSTWEDPCANQYYDDGTLPPGQVDAEGYEYIMTVIPDNALPGMTLIVEVPDTHPETGQQRSIRMQMIVPEGAQPGMVYKLKIQRQSAIQQQEALEQQLALQQQQALERQRALEQQQAAAAAGQQPPLTEQEQLELQHYQQLSARQSDTQRQTDGETERPSEGQTEGPSEGESAVTEPAVAETASAGQSATEQLKRETERGRDRESLKTETAEQALAVAREHLAIQNREIERQRDRDSQGCSAPESIREEAERETEAETSLESETESIGTASETASERECETERETERTEGTERTESKQQQPEKGRGGELKHTEQHRAAQSSSGDLIAAGSCGRP